MSAPFAVNPVPTPDPDNPVEQQETLEVPTETRTKIKRTRPRPQRPNVTGREQEIVNRVRRFFRNDQMARREDMQARLQRHAKMRMWVDESYAGPWEGSSNIALGDIMAVVLRTEDTLQNAILSTRPIVTSKSVHELDSQRESKVDMLHDYQFFSEQNGEHLVEMCSCDFVRDGSFKALTRYVREQRKSFQTRSFGAIPPLMDPSQYFRGILENGISNIKEMREVEGSDSWDWEIRQGSQWLDVRFYTDSDQEDEVLMEISSDIVSYDGPCTIRYSYEHVLYPYWCENLQPPGPSNPKGASHVILVDHPTIDEVKRLVRSGEYNLIGMEDVENLQPQYSTDTWDYDLSLEKSSDEMRGYSTNNEQNSAQDRSHGTVCRLMCFDLWEPGEGEPSVDVIWTVLKGPDLLVRAQHLGEVCPGNPPRRPVSSAAMIPIPGRVDGIGIPELMEALHDDKKITYDMMIDACHIEMIPGYTYRQSSMVNPEEYKIAPGHGMPVGQRGDIEAFQVRPQAIQIGTNLITLYDQQLDALTMVGDLQLGRIPSGKSSALRTAGGIQQVLAQGEARPERILRRFFSGFRTIFSHMWALNRNYLPDEKQFRILGISGQDESIVSITREADLSGEMLFEFQANVLNASKIAMQQAMETVLTLLLNPLSIQTGISDPESLYRVMTDYLRALGQNPQKYLKRPSPRASKPKIMAQEALYWIVRGELPVGVPSEASASEHLDSINQILSTPTKDGGVIADLLSQSAMDVLRQYIQQVRERAIAEQQAQQQQASAASLQTQLTQQGGRGATSGQQTPQNPIVERGDVINESLPSSGTPQ